MSEQEREAFEKQVRGLGLDTGLRDKTFGDRPYYSDFTNAALVGWRAARAQVRPDVIATFETVGNGITGSTSAPVKRVDGWMPTGLRKPPAPGGE